MRKKVMCFGAFDLFHEGHRFFLSESKKLGDELIITIARDANIKKFKGNDPMFSETVRQKTVQQNFPDAEVCLGNETDFYKCIEDYKPDILCLGYDQNANEKELLNTFPFLKIIRIDSHLPDEMKSSILKEKLK